jgi:hypothetical protein
VLRKYSLPDPPSSMPGKQKFLTRIDAGFPAREDKEREQEVVVGRTDLGLVELRIFRFGIPEQREDRALVRPVLIDDPLERNPTGVSVPVLRDLVPFARAALLEIVHGDLEQVLGRVVRQDQLAQKVPIH